MNKRVVIVKNNKKKERYEIADIKEMASFAKSFSKYIGGGDILALSGELGSGKTAFVKALAKALGIKKTVTSPTFVVMNVYGLPKKYHGAIQLCHVDAYRLKSAKELETLGAQEYIGDTTTITAIEWPEQVRGSFLKNAIRIDFKIPKK